MSEANPLAHGLFQPFRTLGIHTFRFALFPEGEAMVAFNRSEEAHVTDFTSPAVWATGSSLAVLEEYLGKIHPDDAPGMVAFVEKHLGTAASGSVGQGPVYYAAHQFQAAMDAVDFRWYELRTQLSLDASGALVIVEGCFLDISALKERELELEEKTVALEREVAGHLRTQASLEQALAELKSAQQRLLEQARLKALGEMVSGVAHDFGNLLGPIQMAAALIGEEVEGPANGVIDRDEVGALAADIEMAAKDGAELIATLRAAYLPEASAGPERGPIRLVPLLEGVRRMARARHQGLGGRVRIEVHAEEEVVVQGSESLLRHALLNLVFNAIDASVDKESSEVMTVRLDLGHGPEGGEHPGPRRGDRHDLGADGALHRALLLLEGRAGHRAWPRQHGRDGAGDGRGGQPGIDPRGGHHSDGEPASCVSAVVHHHRIRGSRFGPARWEPWGSMVAEVAMRIGSLLLLLACAGRGSDATSDTGVSATIGTTPAELETVCADTSLLSHFALDEPVDFLALRRVSDMGEPAQEEVDAVGTACGGASDLAACEATLASTWPTSTGWGYCGEGCSDSGLVWTRGDEVGLADTSEEVAAFFGSVDAPAEVLLQVTAAGYLSVDCPTMRELEDGSHEVEAVWLVSDCEWTEETRRVRVAPNGTLTVVEVLGVYSDGACA